MCFSCLVFAYCVYNIFDIFLIISLRESDEQPSHLYNICEGVRPGPRELSVQKIKPQSIKGEAKEDGF